MSGHNDFKPVWVRGFDASKLSMENITIDGMGNRVAGLTYDGALPILQFGTKKSPVKARWGLSRWNPQTRKFVPVTSPDDTDWVQGTMNTEEKKKRSPTGKFSFSLELPDYEKEGTQDYYTFQAFTAIREFVLDKLINGNLFAFPVSRALAEKMYKCPLRMSSTINEKTGLPYPPELSTKVRWRVNKGDTVTLNLDITVIDVETNEPASDIIGTLRNASGTWVVKVNNLIFKETEVQQTVDVFKCRVAAAAPFLSDVPFAEEEDEDGGGGGGYGGAGAGGYAGATAQ